MQLISVLFQGWGTLRDTASGLLTLPGLGSEQGESLAPGKEMWGHQRGLSSPTLDDSPAPSQRTVPCFGMCDSARQWTPQEKWFLTELLPSGNNFMCPSAMGKFARVGLVWAGKGGHLEGFNPSFSHGSTPTPARVDSHCHCWGRALQLLCSYSRHSWLGQAQRVRVQPLLVSIPGLQKVQICFSNSDLGRQQRQLQHSFSYIHILDSHRELLVIKKQSNEAGFGVHLLAIWYQLSPSLLTARNWRYLIHKQN